MGFSTQHKYREGDSLVCASCGTQVRIRLHKPGEVAIATPGSMGDRVCICDRCGRIFCHPCTSKLGIGIPKCDSCGGDVTLPCVIAVSGQPAAAQAAIDWKGRKWVITKDGGISGQHEALVRSPSGQTAKLYAKRRGRGWEYYWEFDDGCTQKCLCAKWNTFEELVAEEAGNLL
jgi:hypothetical protein